MTSALRLITVLVLGLVIGGTLASYYLMNNPLGRAAVPELPFSIPSIRAEDLPAPETGPLGRAPAATVAQDADTVIEVYERVSPAVVNITFTARARDAFGRAQMQEGTGSGFIIDREGHIATNHHVVGGANRLDVTLSSGDSYVAELVGADRANDLAVVRLQAPREVLGRLAVANLGDSDQLRVGETVLAIGNPFGLERSASMGIVSSLGRTRPGESERLISNMIQTDAAINPGNSGGPLLNLRGDVIGINEQIEAPARGNVGIGFAVPVNALKRFLPDMLAGREPQHAWMGISGSRLTPTLAEQFNLSISQGVIVVQIISGGPAARSGLRGAGNNPTNADIITDIDGRTMRSVEDIIRYVDSRNPGDTIWVTSLRGGRFQTVDVALGVWPAAGVPIG